MNRSGLFYECKPPTMEDADVLNRIRDIWQRRPFYGYRRITRELQSDGFDINRKRVQRLMVQAGIQAIYPGPKTSQRNKSHAVYPYLLKNLAITRPNQVWQVDITYLRMGKGWMYLVALIDVYSRYVVGWSLSNMLDTSSCIEALTMGLKFGKPCIINSDQGSQFTSEEWTDTLKELGIKISMTGTGRCLDNVYIERFWRSFKQEAFYLHEYGNVSELRQAIEEYIDFYNSKRWHQSLNYEPPASVYWVTASKTAVDSWTSPSDPLAPFGTCGQVKDNANALPTT